jgi:PAS domain S-box-containing protein
MSEVELLTRKLNRERAARKEAESLLEQKSREVYQSNQQLRDLAEQTKAIVETAAEGIVTYDPDGTIRSFNRSAQRIFLREMTDGLNIRDLFELSVDSQASLFECSVASHVSEINEDGEPSIPEPVQYVGIRANGKRFSSEVSFSCTTVGDLMISTALIRDLSRRKKLEARLIQAQKMESVGQLAAGIAHEINTPIQFIGNNMQFLQGAFNDLSKLLTLFDQLVGAVKNETATDEILSQIDQQIEMADLPFLREEFPAAIGQSMDGIERVATIVRAMKEFSKPALNSKSAIDLNHAVENALAVSVGQHRGIASIDTSLDANAVPLMGLESQLNQVLVDLIANACEAIADHCEPNTGTIRISTQYRDGTVELRVQDNGPGIPPEIMNRIFDPFFTTKDVGKGTGQGLAFVYDVIVNKHDGSIHAHSSPGDGTTLVITLPTTSLSTENKPEHAWTTS